MIIQKIIDDAVSEQKANRDYRVKFPDDVQQDNLAGQLWFGAEVTSVLNVKKYICLKKKKFSPLGSML